MGKQLGNRPRPEEQIQSQLRAGKGMLTIARECKVGTGTIQRICTGNGSCSPFRRRKRGRVKASAQS